MLEMYLVPSVVVDHRLHTGQWRGEVASTTTRSRALLGHLR